MPGQVLSEQVPAVAAFARLLRAHAALTRELNAQLVADHGLTINDYEVLLQLASAPERRMKRVELANSVVLTPSGITRLLDGLEEARLVDRATCDGDRRVTYAVLTDEGAARLQEASAGHLVAIQALFADRFSEAETVQLSELLGRFPGAGDGTCRALSAA